MFLAENIEKGKWWDEGIKLVSGCTKISESCDNCWALGMEARYGEPTEVVFHEERLKRFTKKKPTVFAIWNDLFHEKVTDQEIFYALGVMCIQGAGHLYLILTKRPERARLCFDKLSEIYPDGEILKNLWLGTTVENQRTADERIPLLLQTPASKRFLSVEPMLGEVNLVGMYEYFLNHSAQLTR